MKRGRAAIEAAADAGEDADGGRGAGAGAGAPGTERWVRSLRVRRIVKENHGEEIADVVFNRVDPTMAHMIATVGARQLNVYDNEHRGDHLDLVSHYVDDAPGKVELTCCCWIRAPEDALIAVGATDGVVRIVSLTRSAVLRHLSGHKGAVVAVFAGAADGELFSVGRDDGVRRWDVVAGECSLVVDLKATAGALSSDGARLYLGTATGDLYRIDIAAAVLAPRQGSGPAVVGKDKAVHLGKRGNGSAVDCLRVLPDAGDSPSTDRLLSKCINGKIELGGAAPDAAGKGLVSFVMKGAAGNNQSRFDVSADGALLCVGDGSGKVYIFNVATGKLLTELQHKRSRQPVRACAFNASASNIVYVGGEALIWRYDAVDVETANGLGATGPA